MADDTTKYRTKEEESEWSEKDPLARFGKYLEKKGLWSEEDTARVKEEAKATVNEHIKKAEAAEKMTVAWLDRFHVRNNSAASGRAKSRIPIKQ